jgi:hypothetical protein
MRRLPRFIPAIILVVLYVMIVMSPLAPLALRFPVLAHAITGECVSDCSVCGCSPERIANHTCCCCQKKHLHEHNGDQDAPECCRKKPRVKNATSTISSCPCGSNKMTALFGVGQSELLPFLFSLDNVVIFEASLNTHIPACRHDWSGEPPDPPPKLTHFT